jgi:hypothetical protein
MKKLLIPLVFAGLAVGCSGDVPTSTDGLTPNFGAAGNSGCYTVDMRGQASGQFPFFTFTTTGDVEANGTVLFDVGTLVFHGVVVGASGVETWNVTGGNIPELMYKSFTLNQRSITIQQPDNDPLIWRINGNARAASGISTANLTLHGTFDARDLTPPFEVDNEYHGVICP